MKKEVKQSSNRVEERHAREAEALRANLKRRKKQARERTDVGVSDCGGKKNDTKISK